ncbi:MAG TPA: hypothetical protein VF701_05515 [Thermoanaerobaculia bacterium]
MKKKSRVEILRGKLRRMGESDDIHPEMTEDAADAFLAEIRFNPCGGPIAARAWSPSHRNHQPWIAEMLANQPRLRARITGGDRSKEPVN